VLLWYDLVFPIHPLYHSAVAHYFLITETGKIIFDSTPRGDEEW
jgi:hypothetical protein